MTDIGSDGFDELELLRGAAESALAYLSRLPAEPAAPEGMDGRALELWDGPLREDGVGAAAAIDELVSNGLPAATRSAGPRFFHFVTGGATPAALAADWLTSALDQNSFSWVSSPLGSRTERVAVDWLKQLFGLPASWGGVVTTGATMANFVALGAARHWWGLQHGRDVEESGWAGMPALPVLSSGYLHVSAVKALTMLGVGRGSIRRFSADPTGRVDLDRLAAALRDLDGMPSVVIATAGEVNAGDFDPIGEMADLAHGHHAWLHVDGAFGLFARVSTVARDLGAGLERADSAIADGHKWLNVPYDCGFGFVRDPSLLHATFAATGAPYLPTDTDTRPSFGDRGAELSRRARALAVWATLRAYGASGYRAMVDRHVRLAQRVGAQVEADPDLELLAPVRLNVVCFRYRPRDRPEEELDELNRRLAAAILADGRVYFGSTVYGGRVAFRPAISNWRTTEADADLIVQVTKELGEQLGARSS
ncbi:MAG TPA: pyridoxal-dependent decarboxylase [Candidatus Dormibacteraeota bacterium]